MQQLKIGRVIEQKEEKSSKTSNDDIEIETPPPAGLRIRNQFLRNHRAKTSYLHAWEEESRDPQRAVFIRYQFRNSDREGDLYRSCQTTEDFTPDDTLYMGSGSRDDCADES
jgi:hypothetical protein